MRGFRATTALALVLALAGCMPAAVPGSRSPGPSGSESVPGAPALIVDLDMDSSDIMALPFLLTLPDREVLAVTVTATGVGRCPPGSANARAIAQLVGSEVPTACGPPGPAESVHPFPDAWRGPADLLYGVDVPLAAASRGGGGAVELLTEVIGASAQPVEIVTLGPLTNVAALLASNPALESRIARLVVMGGAIDAPGNVTADPAPGDPEWNIWADPSAAAAVFATAIPITLVPLDATDDVPIGQAFLDVLAADHRAAGADLVYELLLRNRFLVGSNQFFWDQLTSVVLEEPDAVTTQVMDLAVGQDADAGRTMRAEDGRPVTVAIAADLERFTDAFLAGLRRGPASDDPFAISGELEVTWDGRSCRVEPTALADGAVEVTLADGSGAGGGALLALEPGADWAALRSYVDAYTDGAAPPENATITLLAPGMPTVVDLEPGRLAGVACFTVVDGAIVDPVLAGPVTIGP